MKKIVAKFFIMLSMIFIVISICGMSTIDCLKSVLPIQQIFIFNKNMINAIYQGNINLLPYKLIPLFYISLICIVLSGILNFTNDNKLKSIITIIISCIPIIYVMITHNYIWFLIFLNIYFLLHILLNFCDKNKFNIFAVIASAIIGLINIIKLIEHLTLEFNANNLEQFEITLINTSKKNLIFLTLWIFPYTILVFKEIIVRREKYK